MTPESQGWSATDRAAVARAALAEAERLVRSRAAPNPPAASAHGRQPGASRGDADGPRPGAGHGGADGRRPGAGPGGTRGAWAAADDRGADGARFRAAGDAPLTDDVEDGVGGGRARRGRGRRGGPGRAGRGRNARSGTDEPPTWADGDDTAPDESRARRGSDADPEQMARAICLRLLTGQPRTRAELAAALAKRNVPVEAAEAVLDRFSEVGLIDDAAFARAWVETRQRGRGLGRSALAGELRRKGIDRDVAQEALEQIDADDDLEAARRLVERKLAATRGLAPDKRARRLVGMLARRGHPAGLAYRVVREALAAEGTDPDIAGVPDPTLTDE
ncbi:regulatory protein RecX [Cryptosporangium minutisporangium]|uniref:Regulatory protein RecX n=1 Tax=Cryptosporangium minutisporangium TaxID=113569 RepID=A0ABP6STC1_9ACTN